MKYKGIEVLDSITVDCAIFGFENNELKVLLVRRNIEPQKGIWALPGGWIGVEEDVDDAAKRILEEATGVGGIFMKQVSSFGRVSRFPDKRIITIGYSALVQPQDYSLRPGQDTSDVVWQQINEVGQLTFDHNEILEASLKSLRTNARHALIGIELLPEKFTLSQLQALHEAILGVTLNKRNFRTKMNKLKVIKALNEWQTEVSHRPAQLYTFDKEQYYKIVNEDYEYELIV
ncbi:NUDIX hydrolase [Chondrinema litorale]|uniref:NUDIX hydrolase n=1 Tax=Chondrinema litorale TaxID=2994555 RepID=UPI0025435716|nr:NUDIX domain-containing protein [Chondrinema litorale]UZR93507.1 NUDIX domain-containing protein [Chondrinema litorale]